MQKTAKKVFFLLDLKFCHAVLADNLYVEQFKLWHRLSISKWILVKAYDSKHALAIEYHFVALSKELKRLKLNLKACNLRLV